MPTGMTFASLQQDVQRYLERATSVDATAYAQLPSLINLAERNISRDLKITGFIVSVTTAFVAGTSTYAKPTRWRDTVSMHYGTGQVRNPIFPRSFEYCRMYWPDPTAQAAPLFYADYDYTNWLVSPTPDAAYNVEVLYYQLPALLDATNTTNWVTDYAPQVLLYRTLYEAAMFLKDDASGQRFQGLYSQAMSALNTEDLQRIVDRTSTRQQA